MDGREQHKINISSLARKGSDLTKNA